MAKQSKRFREAQALIEDGKFYSAEEAVALVKKTATAKFDETIELHVRLGVDPKYADQQVRGAIVLPNGIGKTKRVLAFAEGEKAAEAQAAGADYVGSADLAAKIQGGWFDFDVAVATPDMMRIIGRLGKLLGPRGLMPNPKLGTVTPDIAKAIAERVPHRQARQHSLPDRKKIFRGRQAQRKLSNAYRYLDSRQAGGCQRSIHSLNHVGGGNGSRRSHSNLILNPYRDRRRQVRHAD